jgi:hypothetical protein
MQTIAFPHRITHFKAGIAIAEISEFTAISQSKRAQEKTVEYRTYADATE